MRVVVLASGSKGNATYLETGKTKILIDAGISLTQIKSRLLGQGIVFQGLDAVFITHEHVDHTGQLQYIIKQTQAPVYMAEASYQQLYFNRRNLNSVNFINSHTKYQVGDFWVVPLTLSHDAKNTFGFLIKTAQSSLAYITDTGYLPPEYHKLLQKMQVLILEANHDVEMLLNSQRIWPLKQRILSNQGHLSNDMCHDILTKVISPETKYIVLAHLSEECNTPELAYRTCIKALVESNAQLYIAKQSEAVPCIDLRAV